MRDVYELFLKRINSTLTLCMRLEKVPDWYMLYEGYKEQYQFITVYVQGVLEQTNFPKIMFKNGCLSQAHSW